MAQDSFCASVRLLAGQSSLLLGWSPDGFWQATPDELATILAAYAAPAAAHSLPRTTLFDLMELHPDAPPDTAK